MTNQISVQDLPSIHHNSIPVITTELLAKLYDAEINSIQQNFKRNSERFVAGKHYFKISGEDLRNLRLTMSQLQISPKTRSLILWTERGAARHAKMLETDQAWDVFEALEDFYFNQKDVAPATASVKTTTDERTPLRDAINMFVGKRGLMYPEACSFIHQRFNVNHIDELPIEQISVAIEYVHKLVLEGEFLGKQRELPAPSKIQFTDDELCSLCWLWRNAVEMISSISDVYPILQAAEHRLAGKYYSMPREYPRNTNIVRRLLERETAHIECVSFTGSDWRVLHSLRIPNSPF
ncbi:P22AR C-terminal domain-containing protein [Photorhabdus luminescens]|uniref:P22AR C-terminal domain-containing protein n=1 Tax=Photorhabdus luminescens TaxID=29488 RepID=UPI002240D76C|nr:P22AR C-terminal domain-containing protein [Photorhabdus luminescens]MCW7764326.1 ORF6N domain-containing protein [Photorhabdus luminescens subsp. venezuelensis]